MDYPCQQEEPSWFRQVLLDAAATSACQGQQQSAKPSSSLLSGSVATTTATGGGGSITERLHRDCTPADLWIGGIIDDVADGDDRELRTSFQRRVASFRPTNYFGRPTSLSPVVCARFGWKVQQIDRLMCEECRAIWDVPFPSTVTRTLHLSRLYEEELSTRHESVCRYRCQARLHRDEMIHLFRDLEKRTTYQQRHSWRVVPSAMEPLLFTRATRRLLRYPPVLVMDRFRGHYRAVLRVLAASLPHPDTMTWLWTIPASVQEYRPENDAFFLVSDNVGETTAIRNPESAPPGMTLLERIRAAMETDIGGDVTHVSNAPQPLCRPRLEDLAVALILFGWSDSLLMQVHDSDSRSETTANNSAARETWRLTCPFTLAVLELTAVGMDAASAPSAHNHPAAERSSRSDVAKAHRYYSPYVCGFPFTWSPYDPDTAAKTSSNLSTSTTLPLWKALAARLLLPTVRVQPRIERPKRQLQVVAEEFGAPATIKPYDAYEQALNVLRSALSPSLKRRRPAIQPESASRAATSEQRF